MRTPRRRVTAAGETRWVVRFRTDGRQRSETFDDSGRAWEFCHLIDDLGGPEAAQAYLDRRAVEQGNQVSPRLADWFERYVEQLTGVDARTRDDYRRAVGRRFLDELGDLPVDAIDRTMVARWLNGLESSGGLSAKTIANSHGLFSACMADAVRVGLITSNPCHRMRLPRTGEEDVDDPRFLTHAEYDALEAAVPSAFVPLVRTLVGTGLRWSEATAVRRRDVDLETGTVRVVRAWKYTRGVGFRIGPPKTKRARRTVMLPAQVVEALEPLCAGRDRDVLVFRGARGGAIRNSNFRDRVWLPATAAAGLEPRPRIHDLRHTHASWLLELGIGLEAISDQLGHESILTTRTVYGHLQPAMRTALAEAATTALSRRPAALPHP